MFKLYIFLKNTLLVYCKYWNNSKEMKNGLILFRALITFKRTRKQLSRDFWIKFAHTLRVGSYVVADKCTIYGSAAKTARLELDPRELAGHKRKASPFTFSAVQVFPIRQTEPRPRPPQWPENFSGNIEKWFPAASQLRTYPHP